jgi:hypothetical protein
MDNIFLFVYYGVPPPDRRTLTAVTCCRHSENTGRGEKYLQRPQSQTLSPEVHEGQRNELSRS